MLRQLTFEDYAQTKAAEGMYLEETVFYTRQPSERYKNSSETVDLEGDMAEKKEFKVVSLFSGCGGLDLGFHGGFEFLGKKYAKHPFKVIFANDIMPSAVETYNQNFKEKSAVCKDIRQIVEKEDFPIKEADVVLGGFPCQDFSLAGKRRGFSSERGKLYWQMKKVIELTKPKVFVAENVKGLFLMPGALEKIKNDFKKIMPAYDVQHDVLLAADYGVPQMRERVIIIGVRKDLNAKFLYPEKTHAKIAIGKRKPWVSAFNALNDLSDNHPNQNQVSNAKNYGVHLQGNKTIDKDAPAPTIRAEHHGNIEFHYNGDRRLSVRECARIQSFPDSFSFPGTTSKNYVLIGNAVPPVLGWHVAKSVFNVLQASDAQKS